jgi:hypothetical protein
MLQPNLGYYVSIFRIFMLVLRKTIKNLSQDSWSLGQYLNLSP